MTAVVTETANAKVNLTLGVHGRRDDGYHELSSLVAFAAIGDRVTVDPAGPTGIVATGPFAASIDGANLLEHVIERLALLAPRLTVGAVTLEKRLPVAAGLGGGSADAAALMRAIMHLNPDRAPLLPWDDLARSLGADVPVCLANRPALMSGIGERLLLVPDLPRLGIVLANPRVPLSTAAVFSELAAPRVAPDLAPPAQPHFDGRAAGLIDYMRADPNALEPPARRLCPAIDDVLAVLARSRDVLIARMSGSGPTCFALFADLADAQQAAAQIAAAHPEWWIAAATLAV